MLKRFQITARAVNHQGHVIDIRQNVNATSVNAAIAILKEELIGCTAFYLHRIMMMKVVNLSRVGLKTLVPPVPTCEKHT
ncbi:hypothetical protein ACG6V9_002823 [Escherichia coli]